MRSSLTLALLLVLGACALPQQQSRAAAPYQPIEAYITAITPGGPLFHVNRPAYVAMFYISPGSGVSMLYPGFGSGSLSGRAFAGSHFASTRMNNQSQYIFTRASVLQPRFYFLVASEQPLNVSQFGAFGDGLRSRLGSAFASFSAFNTMEVIARQVLPSLPDDGSWTSDMYVEWPDVIHSEPGRARVLVECAGYSMWVAREHMALVRTTVCDAVERHEAKEPQEPNDHDDGREPIDEGEEQENRPVRSTTRSALAASQSGGARGGDRSMSTTLRERISSSTQLSAASVTDAPWANAMATPRSGTSRDGYTPHRTYTSGNRSPAAAATVQPATTRAPAAGSATTGGARGTAAPSSGGSSSGGDSGGRSRPTPSQ